MTEEHSQKDHYKKDRIERETTVKKVKVVRATK